MKRHQHIMRDPRELALENRVRMDELEVDDPLLEHYQRLGLSPVRGGEVAQRFGKKLSRKLDRIELDQALNGAPPARLPVLDLGSSVELGKTPDGQSYRLAHTDLNKHILTAGGTGSGKTVFGYQLLRQLALEHPLTIFDHKDEGSRFAQHLVGALLIPPSQERWNLLRGAKDQAGYALLFGDLLERLAALARSTANATTALIQRLASNPDDLPALSDLVVVLEHLAETEGRAPLFTAARAVRNVATMLGDWARVRRGPDDEATRSATIQIFPRKDMPPGLEAFLATLFFKRRMDRASQAGHTNAIQEVFYFDEGRGFFGREHEAGTGSGRLTVQSEVMTKARSYGLPFIINTQSATMLQRAVVDNAATFVALKVNSEAEAKFCGRRLGLPEERFHELLTLSPGQGFVVSPTWPEPVLIQVPFFDLGPYLSDDTIAAQMGPKWAERDAATEFAPVPSSQAEPLNFRDIVEGHSNEPEGEAATTEETREASDDPENEASDLPPALRETLPLLQSCQAHPQSGVSEHYRRLGWSAGKGNRIKAQLLDAGLVTTMRQAPPQGGRPREILTLTERGQAFLEGFNHDAAR